MSEQESKRRARLLAITGSTVISGLIAGVLWWAFGDQEEGEMVELYTVDKGAVEELVKEVRANESADPLGRTPLQADLAARLLKQKHHRNIFDEFANYVNDPNLEEKRRFKEHPDGEFTIR
ncbi:MAG: hypothetical protein MK291_12575, partial [Planctomycetes bacterium]|nr:hypothetical protein [Planctomycetota bacterium]